MEDYGVKRTDIELLLFLTMAGVSQPTTVSIQTITYIT